jgi:hypothetical protein
VLGIVPQHITFDIALSETLYRAFEDYIAVALKLLAKYGFSANETNERTSLESIVVKTRDPRDT